MSKKSSDNGTEPPKRPAGGSVSRGMGGESASIQHTPHAPPTKPGLYPSLDFATYLAIDAVSSGDQKAAIVSLRAYWQRKLYKKRETDPMRVGSATHCAVFEPDKFADEYTVWGGGVRNKRHSEWRDFKDRADKAGQTVLTQSQNSQVLEMSRATRSLGTVSNYLLDPDAHREVTLLWEDPQTGLLCKARPDYWSQRLDAMLEYKTTASADPDAFIRGACRMDYPIQIAHYLEGIAVVCGEKPDPFFLVQQNDRPYDRYLMCVPESAVAYGAARAAVARERIAHGLANDFFPGIAENEVLKFELPPWLKSERELEWE